MASRLLILAAAAATLAGCQSHPRDTILTLNMDTPRFQSPACRAARAEALRYDDRSLVRSAVAVAGDWLVAPFVGTAASMAMSAGQDKERERLNQRLVYACQGDPYNDRRYARGPAQAGGGDYYEPRPYAERRQRPRRY